MTKKDYLLIAKAMSAVNCRNDGKLVEFWFEVADELATALKRDNPRFDYDKFIEACQV